MQVVGDDLRRDAVEPAQVIDGLEERLVRREVLEVADVMAHHHVGAERHGDRGLELGADRQDRPSRAADERQRLGRHAPRARRTWVRPSPRGAHDRVVAPDVDRPVVAEHAVDEAGEADARIVVRVGDGLVAEVAARHHQGSADARQEQVVQRRVREEEAEVGQPRRDRRGHRRAGRPRRQHDRPTDGRERRDGRIAQRAQAPPPPRGPAPSPRRACRRGPCDGGAPPRPPRRWRRRPGGSRRSPSPPTISPPRSATTAASRAASPRPSLRHLPRARVHASCGPHRGHALGWAWNRRSDGSSYSAWHAGHIVKPAIVVAGRS